jgi:Uma2 family endonuclease
MVVAVAETKTYTADEYLTMEVKSDLRHEYHDGEIIPMPGGTPAHNQIAVVINALLWLALRGKDFCIFNADQRLSIPDRNIYTYPDVMVTPRPYELQPGRKDTVTNPVLIVEVLSDSTKAYDRDEKFAAYRTIPTFQEYLLIDQLRCHVEQFTKQGENQWLFTEYSDREARITLTSIKVEIAVADLYENVLWEGDVQPENS